MFRRRSPIWFALAAALAPAVSAGQETSVRPGINDPFVDPDVPQFLERFEKEGRDVYDHRVAVLEAVGLRPGQAVADVGAGTGLFSLPFARVVGPEGRVYAVDIADEFVAHVEQRAEAAGLTNVEGVLCGADDVRLPPESVDVAFICDTYHHFEFPLKTMASLWRALKPGGQVVLIDFHRLEGVSREWTLGHVRAGQEVFTREIESCGFRQIGEEKGLLKESYFVRFEKVAEGEAAAAAPTEAAAEPEADREDGDEPGPAASGEGEAEGDEADEDADLRQFAEEAVRNLLRAMAEEDREAYLRDADDLMRSVVTAEEFAEALKVTGAMFGRIERLTYLGHLRQKGRDVFLYQARGTDTKDDVLVRLVLTPTEDGPKVSGFWLQ